jgi:VCBS repeat-containing protein
MTILQPLTKIFRCGLIAGVCLAASNLLHAVAPNAVDDNLTATPVTQTDTRVIPEATLIANDAGDGKNIKSVGASSFRGAAVSWNNGSKNVTYDPRSASSLIALGAGQFVDDTFTYVLQGSDGPDSSGTVTVRVNGVNDAPSITGMAGTTLNINDKNTTSTPFTGVIISDPDTDDSLTVTITINPAANGSFAAATGVTNHGNGSYTTTGSASQLQARVRALVFVPTENRITPGTSDNTSLTVSVSDGIASPVSASRTVSITSVNDTPVVTTGATRNMADNESQTIFSNVSLSDPDVGQNATVTVNFNSNKGSFSGGSFVLSGSSPNSRVLTLPTQSFAAAQAALRALIFTPSPNQKKAGDSENLSFAIQVSDGTASGSGNLTVSVLSVNDPPVLSPATVGPFNASAGATLFPFAAVTLVDPDVDDEAPPSGIESPGERYTATIVLSPSPYGALLSSNFATSGNSFTYTYEGNRSEVQNAIQAANYLAPSSNGTFQIALTVRDASNNSSNTVTASVNVTTPTPGISGLVADQELSDNSVIFPFASAAFNNFGGIERYVAITLDSDAKGQFDILGTFSKSGASAPFTYSMAGNSVSATDAIRGLRFRPTPNRIIGTLETVTFTIAVKTSSTGSTLLTETVVVKVTPFNDAPTILGSTPEIRINDDEFAKPFANLTVADVDEGGAQSLTVTITLMGSDPSTNAPIPGGGELLFSPEQSPPYTFSGTPSEVTAVLQSLEFAPEFARNRVGERETVRFTVTVSDGKGGSAQNSNATVIVTSVNSAPQIKNIPALSQQPFAVPASGNGTTLPFAALVVDDKDRSVTLTITLDDAAKGTLNTTNFSLSNGAYSMKGSPEDVTAALKALVYTLNPAFAFPPGQTGLTTFTLSATDDTNITTRFFTIFIRDRNVAHIVTSAGDSGPGTLRNAIDLAGNGDTIVFDFPVDSFPVTIPLDDEIRITKNLHIVGSGVSQLAISGQGSAGIFVVTDNARLTLEQLTLKDGAAASYGGAVAVEAGSALTARYCEFSGNSAGQFGGAIDVFEGELVIENCLFLQNHVAGSIARAGGAVSIYTSVPCSITNTTFVENRQDNPGGDGGGAMYVENADLSVFFNLHLEHCTFRNNTDAKLKGSAVLSASAGMKSHVRNNIFADQQGRVIDVLGGGRFTSLGGNLATDATTTTYTVGAQNVTLLDQSSDKRSSNPLLGNLAGNGGATRTCAPLPGSPAIGAAVGVSPASAGTDQRGYWRGASPHDIGAHEVGEFRRVNINEIFVAGGIGTDFIEFYNPRDSATLNMAGLVLWVDGTNVHTFTNQELAPGEGFAWYSTKDLDAEKGRIELRNASGQRLLLVDYAASFADKDGALVTTGQSINRYPRYEGGFLPHQRAYTNITGSIDPHPSSPGRDLDRSEFGGNAPPVAIADPATPPFYAVTADQTLAPDLLANDIEFDRTDTLKITEVMPLTSGAATNAELLAINGIGAINLSGLPPGLDTSVSPQGAAVTIHPDGSGITYDPTTSPVMIGLAKDQTISDIWAYTIRDYDPNGTPQARGADAANEVENLVKATAWFAVTVTGVNEAPEAADDFAATLENQAVRFLADPALLAPAVFDFGDLPANFQDFDASGNPVTLTPPAPTLALLANDDDVDSDDDKTSLLLGAVHTTEVPADLLVTTSELGATIKLDIRTDRRETSIVYDPRGSAILNALSDGETAEDSFYYSVFDRHGARGVAKVTITVTGVNDVPMARDDAGFAVNEDIPLSIPGATLLANDTDPDQNETGPDDVLTIVEPFLATSTLGAKLSFDGTTIVYDPRTVAAFESLARNETTTDTFNYTAKDSRGGISTATVTVVVEGRNDAPVAADDLLRLLENQTRVVSAASGLLANDVDVDINGTPPDDDPWVIPQRDVTTPLGANLNIYPDGSFRYDANSPAIDSLREGELAVENFPYIVTDNSRTTASDDSFRVLANSANVSLPVLLNDVVAGSAAVSIAGYSADEGQPGKLIVHSPNHALRDGLLVRLQGYQGSGAYNGVYPVTSLGRDRFTVDVPFVDDPAATRGTWTPWFAITNISVSDKGGVVTSSGGQALSYTPAAGFYGTETFTYTIGDGVGGQDVAKVSVEVILPRFNGLLSASDDRFRIGMGTSGVAVDVLANDGILPANGSALTITGITPLNGASGSLEIINNGKTLAYSPATPLFSGTEAFRYTVTGGGSATTEATVTFEVVDRTGRLDANDDAFFVVIGSSGNLLDVLANDPGLPSYPVASSVVAVNGSASGGVTSSGGSVGISGNKVSYTPPAAILTDTFSYTARDASGATATRTVRVRVVPNAVNFYASNDHYMVTAGADSLLLPVLLNDGTVLNPAATLSIVNLGLDTNAPPDVSRVAISNGNLIRYTPPLGATTETFTYEISTGTLERRQATITITVIGSHGTSPDAEDDFYHVAKNSGPHTLDVLKNDIPYPAAGWNWTIVSNTTPSHGGSLAINSASALTYTPAPGFYGTETFSYTIRDAFGVTSTAGVSVQVGSLITAPDRFAVLQGSVATSMPVLANDDLLAGEAAQYSLSAVTPVSVAGGVVAISGTGPDNKILYTPQSGFAGEDTFTYTVADQSGGTRDESVSVLVVAANADRDQALLRVEITGVNDLPIITGVSNGAITDKQTINPFSVVSITDLDEAGNQQQTVTVSFDETFGTVVAPGMTRLSSGVYRRIGTPAQVTASLRGIVFTPRGNFIDYIDPGLASVVFNLSITDGYIPTPILSAATITVTPVNDAPTLISPIPNQVYQVDAFTKGIYLPQHFADVDDDVRGGQLIWTVTGNTNPGLFDSVTINQAGRLLVLDFSATQVGVSDITVRGTDRGMLFVESTFRVTVEGPPMIVLAEGQTRPPAATYVTGSVSGFRRDYRQSFRLANPGTLPVSSFILRVSDLNVPVDGITLHAATFSTNENGTPSNFQDDTVSSVGVTILRRSTYVYDVKYDVLIPPGGSVVVHLTYRVSSIDLVSIRPTIRVSLSTPNFTGGTGISKIELGSRREVMLTFNVLAGRDYRVEFSPDLAAWSPWVAPIPKSDFPRSIQFIDDGLNTGLHPSEAPKRFYRLVELPVP